MVVVDGGEPRNAPSAGVHGYLTREGMSPAELVAVGRAEIAGYGGHFLDAEATSVRKVDEGFQVSAGDRVITARRVVVTTGLVDVLPDVPGVRELWALDVHHCPYCHGWELSGRTVGVLGGGPRAAHQALVFRQWVTDVVLFTHTADDLTEEQAEQLAARGIAVVHGRVVDLRTTDGRLSGVELADGTVVPRQSLVVAPTFVARSAVLESLGLLPEEHPMGQYILTDPFGLTAVPGVWAAGNVTDLAGGVVNAASAGMTVGVAVNSDLITDDIAAAVRAHRSTAAVGADQG